ncbi:MAG TPA: cation diffusion facilitator family transporter [Parachlamydiaceae bacterium]|nr:cation diffusion facilitator family transporter [Parachlamydiaceae bacterium]
MTHFPSPIAVPDDVQEARKERVKQLVRSCLLGVVLRSAIIAVEFVGVYLFGSAALLMDALTSLVDVFSSILLVICIKLAARPPDANHPFGHGRFEPLIGLQLGLFMALVGGGMIFKEAGDMREATSQFVIDPRTWLIPFFAVILLELCYQIVMGVAKKQNSPALAADAVHYRIDSLTSLCAMIALIIASYFPEKSHLIDHIGALFISALMIGIGLNAAWQNTKQLLDAKPETKFFTKVITAAKRVKGVIETEKIRIQLYGPDAHVDIDVEVDPHLSVEVAHAISQKVRVEIQKEWPAVQDVTVHIEPYYPNDH